MDGLTIVAAAKVDTPKPVLTSQRRRKDTSSDGVMSKAVDDFIDMTDIARRIVPLSRKIKLLTQKLDDPANESDPRKGEAEARRFRMVYERSEDKKQLIKIARVIDSDCFKYLVPGVLGEFIDEMAVGFGTTALGIVIPRVPEIRTLPFFDSWLNQVAYHRDAGHFRDREVVPF